MYKYYIYTHPAAVLKPVEDLRVKGGGEGIVSVIRRFPSSLIIHLGIVYCQKPAVVVFCMWMEHKAVRGRFGNQYNSKGLKWLTGVAVAL